MDNESKARLYQRYKTRPYDPTIAEAANAQLNDPWKRSAGRSFRDSVAGLLDFAATVKWQLASLAMCASLLTWYIAPEKVIETARTVFNISARSEVTQTVRPDCGSPTNKILPACKP